MKAASKHYAAVVSNPDMPRTYHASFGVPGEAPRWVMERGARRVFASQLEAELAAYRMMTAHLNRSGVAQEFTARKAPAPRVFRAEGVGKGSQGAVKTNQGEADAVFANFKGGSGNA